jgi:hypothetical protein
MSTSTDTGTEFTVSKVVTEKHAKEVRIRLAKAVVNQSIQDLCRKLSSEGHEQIAAWWMACLQSFNEASGDKPTLEGEQQLLIDLGIKIYDAQKDAYIPISADIMATLKANLTQRIRTYWPDILSDWIFDFPPFRDDEDDRYSINTPRS